MASITTRLVLLVDHDNLPCPSVAFRDVVQEWLAYLDVSTFSYVSDLSVRAFGGWFREGRTTERRFQAAAYYQETCPSALRHSGKIIRVQFQFADSLDLPGCRSIPITHTVVRRHGAVHHALAVTSSGCNEESCELKNVRRWFWKKRACTSKSCATPFSAAFERDEQKQVDTHILTELIALAGSVGAPDEIGIVSSDWDMLPGLLAAALTRRSEEVGITSIRLKGSETYHDRTLRELGVRILESQLS